MSSARTYIIEHLDDELFPWSLAEYTAISHLVQPDHLIISNASFPTSNQLAALDNVLVTRDSVSALTIDPRDVCLLDSESEIPLKPEDASNFKYFLYGGILGNTDEFDFDRTKILRQMGFASRNLGSFQMTTDTAVRVTKRILDGTPFADIPFIDRPEIGSQDGVSLIMNFRYIQDSEGNPVMVEDVKRMLLDDLDFDLRKLE